MLRHKRKLSVTCNTCKKILSSQQALNTHKRIHTGEHPYCCSQCGKKFTDESAYQRHLNIHISNNEKKQFPCKFCDKTFNACATRYIHVKRDHEVSIHQCNSCEYSARYKYDLKSHINHKHSNIEKITVSCQECGKRLKQKCLNNHMKQVHLEPDKYKCEICRKGFASKGNLKTHNLFHAKSKKFPCLICVEQFYTKNSLKLHTKSQHFIERIECGKCDYEGIAKELRSHDKLVHQNMELHNCDLCEFRGKKKIYVINHKKRMHESTSMNKNYTN